MKYAIVEHSGKQYLAQEGGLIEVDRMPLEVGKPIVFKDVLFISDGNKAQVGAPFVKGASVKGKVQDHLKGKKITVFKYRPKQRYRRTQGHRQLLTHISIESIGLPKAETKEKTEAASKPKPKAKKKTEPKSKTQASGKSEAKTKAPAKGKASTSSKRSTKKSDADKAN